MDELVSRFNHQIGLLDFQSQSMIPRQRHLDKDQVSSVKECLEVAGVTYLRHGSRSTTQDSKFKLCKSEFCCPAVDQIKHVRQIRKRVDSPVPSVGFYEDDASSRWTKPSTPVWQCPSPSVPSPVTVSQVSAGLKKAGTSPAKRANGNVEGKSRGQKKAAEPSHHETKAKSNNEKGKRRGCRGGGGSHNEKPHFKAKKRGKDKAR